MKKIILLSLLLFLFLNSISAQSAQIETHKKVMNYIYQYDEALRIARETNKPIFINCFASWAIPSNAMNQVVFTDENFAKWLDENFVILFVDITNTDEGRMLAEKYDINSFAQYVVLNPEGELIHRIVGGKELPKFQELTARALNPETSLAGTNEAYERGNRKKKFLLEYLETLKIAGEDTLYNEVLPEYLSQLKKRDLFKSENWNIVARKAKTPNDTMFLFIEDNFEKFIKKNDPKIVQDKLSNTFSMEFLHMATSAQRYDRKKARNYVKRVKKIGLDHGATPLVLHDIAESRYERRFKYMTALLDKNDSLLTNRIVEYIDATLPTIPNMNGEEKKIIVDYLQKRANMPINKGLKSYKRGLMALTAPKTGIQFENITLNQALEKAKKENKYVFMDCYTTWCGPCKMMAREVFTRKEIGDFFNKNFINLKKDMEKGEGKKLLQKYHITNFPTLLLIAPDGTIFYKMVGARESEVFLKNIEEVLQRGLSYTEIKQKYADGNRDVEFLVDYYNMMIDAYELRGDAVVDFIAGLTDAELQHPKVVWLLLNNVKEVKSPLFSKLMDNYNAVVSVVGEEVLRNQLKDVVMLGVITLPQAEWAEIAEVCTTLNFGSDTLAGRYALLLSMHQRQQWDEILDYYQKEVSQLPELDHLSMQFILGKLLENADQSTKEKAIKYLQNSDTYSQTKFHKVYDSQIKILQK